MNWFYVVVLAFVCVGGPIMYAHARRLDRADQWADIREWHLLHGPTDGCVECGDK